ncbi:hypothetical protein K1X84_04100 [bacterium]|nr:hypothetical protein [bacterium]
MKTLIINLTGFLLILFSATVCCQEQQKKIEISGGLFKTYSINGKKIKDADELEAILMATNNKQVNESFSKARTWNSVSQVFGLAGGALIGYPLGGAIAGKKINKPVLFTGIGITSVSLLFAIQAEKHGVNAVEKYNAFIETGTKIGMYCSPNHSAIGLSIFWAR